MNSLNKQAIGDLKLAEILRGNQFQFVWEPMYWDQEAMLKAEMLDWPPAWPGKQIPERLDNDINPDDPDDN